VKATGNPLQVSYDFSHTRRHNASSPYLCPKLAFAKITANIIFLFDIYNFMTLFLKKSYWYPQKYGHQQLVLYQYSCFKNVCIKWIIGILCMVAFAVSPAKMMQGKSKCKKTII